jgi:hypothetical protein
MKKFAVPALFAAALFAPPAFAGGEIFDAVVDNCAGVNCGAVIEGATVKALGAASAGRWVAEVFGAANQCLRIDVPNAPTPAFTDLETVVVAPNGTVYRNDDGGFGGVNPLVKINPAPNTGWYTVSIGHFNGAAVEGNFTVAVGRYVTSNVNCAAPTPPTAKPAAAKKKSATVRAPQGDEPPK